MDTRQGSVATRTDDQQSSAPSESSYLKQYSTASREDQWPLVRGWIKNSPLGLFKELRSAQPILVTPACTLVAMFDDVVEILKQPKMFTVELYKPKMGNYLMTEDETPLHNTEKGIMQSLLKREDLPRVRQFVADKAKDILDNAQGHIDLATDYSRIVPTAMVQSYFGLDGINPRTLIKWSYWNQYDAFHNQPFHDLPNADEIHRNMNNNNMLLSIYIAVLLVRKWWAIKMGRAAFDVVTRILTTTYPKEAKFNIARQGINAGGLLIGAVETTSQAVIQAIDELMRRPQILAEAITAAQSGDNTKFDGFVWEALRFNITFKYIFRTAAQDYTLAKGTPRETLIPKGTTVLALVQSAMFDADHFPDPETFNPARPYGDSFHFGFGSHECMGKYIGMVMIPEMVRQVLLRLGVHADGPIDRKGGPLPESYSLSWHV